MTEDRSSDASKGIANRGTNERRMRPRQKREKEGSDRDERGKKALGKEEEERDRKRIGEEGTHIGNEVASSCISAAIMSPTVGRKAEIGRV